MSPEIASAGLTEREQNQSDQDDEKHTSAEIQHDIEQSVPGRRRLILRLTERPRHVDGVGHQREPTKTNPSTPSHDISSMTLARPSVVSSCPGTAARLCQCIS